MFKTGTIGQGGYRPDIDGLRAVAVIAVIWYHAFPLTLTGGFCGVDVFFVISGYLITGIIYRELEQNRFIYSSFYGRRARRILPSLIIVMVFVLYVGWLTLLPDEFIRLGRHVVSGSTFLSNVTSINEAGYFDTDASTKPLLHLWSLGVEEQFYLVYPPALWIIHRFFPKRLVMASFLLLLISFVVSAFMVLHKPVYAFYSLPSRFWELTIGSLLAIIPIQKYVSQRAGFYLGISGTSLVLCACVCLSSKLPFPAPLALLPTLGAAMIVAAGPTAYLNRVVLSVFPMRMIGKISYPLYLWHWPLLSYARILGQDLPNAKTKAAALLTTSVLATLTYYLVEKPMRFGRGGTAKVAALCSMLILLFLTGSAIRRHQGFPERTAANMNVWQSYPAIDLTPFLSHECGLPAVEANLFGICAHDIRGKVRYALIGDSKADSLFPGLVATSSNAGRWLIIGGNGPHGAPIPLSAENSDHVMSDTLLRDATRAIIHNNDIGEVAIMASANVLFNIETDDSEDELARANDNLEEDTRKRLGAMVEKFVTAGKHVTLVIDNPALAHPEDCTRRYVPTETLKSLIRPDNHNCSILLSRHLYLVRRYRRIVDFIQQRYQPHVSLFDTTSYVCDMKDGVCGHVKNGHELYSYAYHISRAVADLIGTDLNKILAANGATIDNSRPIPQSKKVSGRQHDP